MHRTILLAVSVGALAGCATSDINTPCTLVKQCPDGGGACPVTEGEVQERTIGSRDFVSFGATDCDDLTCVRDSSFKKGDDLAAPAKGYCSRPCAEASTCTSRDPAMDKDASTKLRCRALLLDVQYGPDGGSGLNVTEPFFCARGG